MKILRHLTACAAAFVLASAPVSTARAQWVVVDPANLAQSILQVANMIEQIANQVEQISNQVQQIEQGAAMLAQNPLQMSPELSASISEARVLMERAEGLSFNMESIGGNLESLYPETYEAYDLDGVLAQSDRWLDESRRSLEQAMETEARANQSLARTESQVDRALQSSSGAEGQTGAIQASNQLLGINAQQLAQIQALLIAQGRALETERMERVAREDRAREVQRRAFPTDASTSTTPARSAFEN